MAIPSKTKYRKMHKGRIKGLAYSGNRLAFGSFGLKALEPERVTERQIEAARRSITRETQRTGRMWIRIFPDRPVTSKPAEVRMGKGKGAVDRWVVQVRPGTILFELDGLDNEVAKRALGKAAAKLPIKTKIVWRDDE